MLRTTGKSVKEQLNKHILSYFNKDCGWESNDTIANLKQQLQVIKHLKTNYARGYYLAEGGMFLCYYEDQRNFLGALLKQTPDERDNKYSNDQVFDTYCHLIARQIAEMAS